jgi:hypothetical protein
MIDEGRKNSFDDFDLDMLGDDDEYPTGQNNNEQMDDDEVLYSKSFVNAFFGFTDFS